MTPGELSRVTEHPDGYVVLGGGKTAIDVCLWLLENGVDPDVRPSMLKGATVSDWEIDLLRRIRNVDRLGRVRRIERGRIVLDEGTVPTGPGHVHVHCTASARRAASPTPTSTGHGRR